MGEDKEIHRDIVGYSIKGSRRVVRLTPRLPSRISITIYAGKKPVSIVVHVDQLTEAIGRMGQK
jgi:hypothetical protein